MKWFGRKAGRVAARPLLFRAWAGAPAVGDWPRSYEAQVREAYLSNPVAQRAVRLVAESVGGAPVYALAGSPAEAGRPEEGRSGPRLSPGNKDERAAKLVGAPLLETVTSQLLLHGNAFVQILCNAEGEPAELFALRPERVKIEADAAGWPVAFVYKAGEAKARLPARDGLGRPAVVHLKAMHPLDDHYGLGCLGAAAGAVAIHNAATKWNKALLDNAARPSGALLFDPGDGAALSGEQFERLPGQAQKELFHNEALIRIEAALQPAIESGPLTEPPQASGEGQIWIIAPGATGAWLAKDEQLAMWTAWGWRFLAPTEGMSVWSKAAGYALQWRGGAWSGGDIACSALRIGGEQVVGPRQPAVPSPSGGTTIDEQARAALDAVIVALKSHGLIQ